MVGAPDRGDIVRLQFNPQAGHEQAGHRPALVLSPRAYNARVGFALCCPITRQSKGYPFEVALPADHEVRGVILADQLKCLDFRARQAEFWCRAPAVVVEEVVARIETLIR